MAGPTVEELVSPISVFRNRYTDDQGQEDYEYNPW